MQCTVVTIIKVRVEKKALLNLLLGRLVVTKVGTQLVRYVVTYVISQLRTYVGTQLHMMVHRQFGTKVGRYIGRYIGRQVGRQVGTQFVRYVVTYVISQLRNYKGTQLHMMVHRQFGTKVGRYVFRQVGRQFSFLPERLVEFFRLDDPVLVRVHEGPLLLGLKKSSIQIPSFSNLFVFVIVTFRIYFNGHRNHAFLLPPNEEKERTLAYRLHFLNGPILVFFLYFRLSITVDSKRSM